MKKKILIGSIIAVAILVLMSSSIATNNTENIKSHSKLYINNQQLSQYKRYLKIRGV